MKNKKLYIIVVIILFFLSCVLGILYIKEKNNNSLSMGFSEDLIVTKINSVDVSEYDTKDKSVLNRAMDEYCSLNNSVNGSMVNILALADLQYEGDYEKESYDFDLLLKKINTISKLDNMDIAVSIGDLNNAINDKETSLENLKEITLKFKNIEIPILFALGNHDRFIKYEPQYDISKEEYFNVTYSNVDSSFIFNENAEDEPYYYKDIEDKKMRICILNSFSGENYDYSIDNEQLKFIANNMLNFDEKENPEEWTVAFFIHTVMPTEYHNEEVTNADELLSILNSYNEGKSYSNKEFSVNYENKKRATIAAIFTGHHHFDYTLVKENILIIGVNPMRSDYIRGDTKQSSKYSDEDTDTSFEIISIDTKNRKIYSTKVGNGQNRFWNY